MTETPEPAPEPAPETPPAPGPAGGDPRNEPIYRAILAVLVASVLVGAVATLTGETLFASPALANAGLGLAVVCGVLYWVFRLLGKRAAERAERQNRD